MSSMRKRFNVGDLMRSRKEGKFENQKVVAEKDAVARMKEELHVLQQKKRRLHSQVSFLKPLKYVFHNKILWEANWYILIDTVA